MQVSSDTLTDAYFMNKSDWLCSMKALKEKLGAKVICESQLANKKGVPVR